MIATITAIDNTLYAILTGKFSLAEAKRTFLQIMAAVEENGSTKVLIDGLGVTGEPTVIERYFFGEFAAHVATMDKTNKVRRRKQKFAYALAPPTLDARRLGETVALNRGMNLRVFDNLADAAAWLDIDANALRQQ